MPVGEVPPGMNMDKAAREFSAPKTGHVEVIRGEKLTLEKFLEGKFGDLKKFLSEDPSVSPDSQQFYNFIATDGGLSKVKVEERIVAPEAIKSVTEMNFYSSFNKGETAPLVAQQGKLLEGKYRKITHPGHKRSAMHRAEEVSIQQNILEMAQLRAKMLQAQFAEGSQRDNIINQAKDDVVKTYTHAIGISALEQLQGEPDMGMK